MPQKHVQKVKLFLGEYAPRLSYNAVHYAHNQPHTTSPLPFFNLCIRPWQLLTHYSASLLKLPPPWQLCNSPFKHTNMPLAMDRPNTDHTHSLPLTRQPLPAMLSNYKSPQNTQPTPTCHTDSALILLALHSFYILN